MNICVQLAAHGVWGFIVSLYRKNPTLSLPVRNARMLPMRSTPHVADADVPGTLVELAHVPDVYPSPLLTHCDLVTRPDFDLHTICLQHGIGSRGDDPFANPLPSA